MASLILNWKLVEAESKLLKHSSKQREQQLSEPLVCLKNGNGCLSEDVHGCMWQGVCWFHQSNRRHTLHS